MVGGSLLPDPSPVVVFVVLLVLNGLPSASMPWRFRLTFSVAEAAA